MGKQDKAAMQKAFIAQTKKLIQAYALVHSDLEQDIGYTRKGDKNRKKAMEFLRSRMWELESVWLDVEDNLDD
jgi:hypothetical protein